MAQSLNEFIKKWDGKYADYDGWYGAQCVDLVNYYHRDVIGGKWIPAEGAKDWFNNFTVNGASDKYSRIRNNMNDPNQLPKAGDIMVWGGTLAGSGGYGHIAIVLSADKKGFTSFDQNFPSGSKPHRQYHVWDSTVLGWLTPKGVSQPPASAPKPVKKKEYVRVFGDYRTVYKQAGKNPFQRIAPNQYKNRYLDYEVLGRSGQYVKIKTQMYGVGWIYVGSDVAHLTQFYWK